MPSQNPFKQRLDRFIRSTPERIHVSEFLPLEKIDDPLQVHFSLKLWFVRELIVREIDESLITTDSFPKDLEVPSDMKPFLEVIRFVRRIHHATLIEQHGFENAKLLIPPDEYSDAVYDYFDSDRIEQEFPPDNSSDE